MRILAIKAEISMTIRNKSSDGFRPISGVKTRGRSLQATDIDWASTKDDELGVTEECKCPILGTVYHLMAHTSHLSEDGWDVQP